MITLRPFPAHTIPPPPLILPSAIPATLAPPAGRGIMESDAPPQASRPRPRPLRLRRCVRLPISRARACRLRRLQAATSREGDLAAVERVWHRSRVKTRNATIPNSSALACRPILLSGPCQGMPTLSAWCRCDHQIFRACTRSAWKDTIHIAVTCAAGSAPD